VREGKKGDRIPPSDKKFKLISDKALRAQNYKKKLKKQQMSNRNKQKREEKYTR
jgi:hypothetical protein